MNEKILSQICPDCLARIQKQECPTCGEKIKVEDFKDTLSLKEFKISGLCQKCQDKIFKN